MVQLKDGKILIAGSMLAYGGVIRDKIARLNSDGTLDTTVELATKLGCQQVQWENRGAVFCDILINCTPVGMHPNVNESPFPMHWLRDNMLVFDTVYNPENTLLLKQARELQKKMKKVQKKVEATEITATAGEGRVTAVVTGKLHVRSIQIDPGLVQKGDVRTIQDLVAAAIRTRRM